MYHIQKSANTDLVLESGTKAIANYALAGSTITSLTLPSGFYSMYPLSMAGCYSLTEVNGNGLSSIKYLGYVFEDEDDFWTSDIPQQNYTYANFNVSSFGCFRLCLNLETIDMTKAVNLKTLGSYCFSDCKKLKNMTNGETYKFYKTSNGVINNTPIDQRSTEVMDLSNCLKLRNVGRGTFRRCPSLKYVIFPNSTNYDGTRESEMNFVYKDEYDGTSELFEGSDPTAIMIGETAFQAYENNNALNASQHYKTGIFSTKVPYYFANSSSDLDLGHGSLKYWAFKNKEQHEYILFDTLAEARAYFNIIENA